MTKLTTKPDSMQPATEMAVDLFDNWFDPIETEVRARARQFIEELIRGELDTALARPRYERSKMAGNEAGACVTGHRHGSRTRSLTGTFGPIEIAVPRARLTTSEGKTTEWKSQALRAYQASYQPRQLSTGLRTSEARMLMVLENDAGLSLAELQREVAMPVREIEEAVNNLKRKALVRDDQDRVKLTTKGIDETESLWTIAREQQDTVFSQFSEEQLETFKTVLKAVIRH